MVSIAEEALHSIKLSKKPTIILKLDLSEEYDRVNWTFMLGYLDT
jgi:hypothetical protein